ncbi:MAG TPA: acetyl-CoA carboxylase biotin carboxylase subunit [Candidatus Polarisedimenticolaceae bacterium]|nr:acetyl-CoA carboxylase biotin carboxylase subunit [Candidatus Polarisedimenticolaceae bacterium]
MFRRVLIANRGEIALRIARSCRALGVESVIVYSAADRGAPWLRAADRTVCIGPARAEASYLDADAILQAAEQTECQAVHPGYGFLAENALFATRCAAAGLSFVGPPPEAIRRLGDKVAAKRTMAAAGLPTIPGSEGEVPDLPTARRVAAEIGYPVLLKAASGGGGRGMRRCGSERELAAGFAAAALEAGKAFGDPALYLEKLIEGGRHVEFQVLADAFGDAIHLGERECSVQRKHQKLIEEAPSPAVDAETRSTLGARVAAAVAGAGYRNAGTVEFLRDSAGRFYFMEMNTRLQVEHPVTEAITGLDLVAEQLRIAALEPLGRRQEQVAFRGHAFEFRINAEDPAADFRPDPGRIEALRVPPGVRWDSAAEAGWRIPPQYDSLIGKLIVHAADRPRALAAAATALGQLAVEGVHTTLPLHRRLLEDPGFRAGRYDLDLLAQVTARG